MQDMEKIDIGFVHRAKTSLNSHFSRIAPIYTDVRRTDREPIILIRNRVQECSSIMGADIGCGCGRYDEKMLQYFGNNLYLFCLDENYDMLRQLKKRLNVRNAQYFETACCPANNLQLRSNSLDFIVTFNSVHHFDLIGFLNEVARTLKDNCYLFVYTRLRSQNKKNIWGRYFPKFCEKENRLCELEEFNTALHKIKPLKLCSVEYFKYKRRASMEALINSALHHHYSTFDLYGEVEFGESLKEFQNNIVKNYNDLSDVFWNENANYFFPGTLYYNT